MTPKQKADMLRDKSRRIYEMARTAKDTARSAQEYLIKCQLMEVFDAGRQEGINVACAPDAPRNGW